MTCGRRAVAHVCMDDVKRRHRHCVAMSNFYIYLLLAVKLSLPWASRFFVVAFLRTRPKASRSHRVLGCCCRSGFCDALATTVLTPSSGILREGHERRCPISEKRCVGQRPTHYRVFMYYKKNRPTKVRPTSTPIDFICVRAGAIIRVREWAEATHAEGDTVPPL